MSMKNNAKNQHWMFAGFLLFTSEISLYHVQCAGQKSWPNHSTVQIFGQVYPLENSTKSIVEYKLPSLLKGINTKSWNICLKWIYQVLE